MTLWFLLALMTAGAIIAVCWPLAWGSRAVKSGSDVAVYRDQLQEIDRDQAADLIGAAEAEAARVEVSRRLIAAAEVAEKPKAAVAPARLYRRATVAAALLLLPLGAGALYSKLGSPNLAPVSLNAEASGQALPQDIEQTVAEVETYLEKNPRNGRGWELLAPVYIRLGRFEDAVKARRNALDIFGPDAARLGDLGEAIFMASGGVVTPEAKEFFSRAETADPTDVMAQYYLGLSAKQEGRRDEAARRWRAIIDSAPQGAEYVPLIKNALARIDEQGPPRGGAAPPDHDESAIAGMVERLAERLRNDGSDVAGWVQLVRSYHALGKTDKATAAMADARAALANNPQGLQQLNQSLGELESGQAAPVAPSARAPASDTSSPPMAGPNAGDIAAASKMAPGERNAMIESMVARLAQRMANNGSDVEGWLRLIRAYSVLGERDKALAAAGNARTALAGNSDSLRRISELAKELGLEGS
jgi:cytochrome c-type biogenesis protein CcmH